MIKLHYYGLPVAREAALFSRGEGLESLRTLYIVIP